MENWLALGLFAGVAGLGAVGLAAWLLARLRRQQAINTRHTQVHQAVQQIQSTLDQPVIQQRVLRQAMLLSGADAGALVMLTSGRDNLIPAYLVDLPVPAPDSPVSMELGVLQRALSKGIQRLAQYAEDEAPVLEWVGAGVGPVAVIPLLAGEVPQGLLLIFRKAGQPAFTDQDLFGLDVLSQQAGLALQSVRQFDNERQRADEFEALRATLSELSEELELQPLLRIVLERAVALLLGRRGEIGLYRPDRDVIEVVAEIPPSERETPEVYPLGDGLLGTAAQRRRALFQLDGAAAPMLFRGKLVGAVAVQAGAGGRRFGPADLNLLMALAQQAAVSVTNVRLFEETQRMAITDSLTGLYNRRHFFHLANREVERANRYHRPLSAIMLDLDRFKRINDTYGHATGDAVLQTVAQRCGSALREVDILARYGGEEFIILLPDTNIDGARYAAQRLHNLIADQLLNIEGQAIEITASLGVATYGPEQCDSLENLLSCADAALYQAKQAGRNQVATLDQAADAPQP